MKYYTLGLVLMVLVGCGHQEIKQDPRLIPYLRGAANVSARIGEFPNEPNIAGKCYRYSFDAPMIVISETHWKYLDEKSRQWLMDHELGHCLENLDHDNSVDENGCPRSKMFWRIPDWKCLH